MELDVKKLRSGAILPTRGSRLAAGYDLHALDDARIFPGETVMIDTGVAVQLAKGTFGAVYARSGLSTKRGLGLANGVGVIDADYRGTIKVPLYNRGTESQWIRKGERIAQLVVSLCITEDVEIVDELDQTERGSGGFGSTGR